MFKSVSDNLCIDSFGWQSVPFQPALSVVAVVKASQQSITYISDRNKGGIVFICFD